MNKLILKISSLLFVVTLLSCESKKKSEGSDETTVVVNTEVSESALNHDFTLRMKFKNADYIQNNLNNQNSQRGMEVGNNSFAVVFLASTVTQPNHEVQIQFDLLDFDLTPGSFSTDKVMLIHSDTEDEREAVMTSKSFKVEVTAVTPFETESGMGITLQSYKVNGTFSGVFTSMMGTEYEVKHGAFNNAILSTIKTQ